MEGNNMLDDIGFSTQTKKKVACKTFESTDHPEFHDGNATFNDDKVGKITVEQKNVHGFTKKGNKYRIKICKK